MTTQLKTESCIFPGLDPGYRGGQAGIKAMAPAPSYYYYYYFEKNTGIRDGARGLGKLLEQARFPADYIFLILREDKV